MEIVKEPYLAELREEVATLKTLVDGEPDILAVTHAWASFAKIKDALGALCPNHPAILANR